MLTPPWARSALVAAKAQADGHCCTITQDTVAALIRDGHLARYVRKMQKVYSRRRQTLLDILHQDFAGALELVPSAAGLHVAALLTRPLDDRVVVARAQKASVGVTALSDYATRSARHGGIVLGYGTIDEADIAEGLSRLRRSL
jgi:GntR family transcriptional regulator / MocR family aminotransferase